MRQPDNPTIELIEEGSEVTLYIDGVQAMQAWERELMHRSAELLCEFGDTFLEVGLGLKCSGDYPHLGFLSGKLCTNRLALPEVAQTCG